MTLIESIYKEPHAWRPSEHSLIHESGAELWIANGVFFCQPRYGSFSFYKKLKAWRAYRWWCENAPVEKFGLPS